MSVYFNGANYAVTTSVFTPSASGSVSFWMYPEELTDTGTYRIMGNDNLWEVRLLQVSSTWRVNNELGGLVLSSISTISINTWYHVVCTYESGDGEVYVNGIFDVDGTVGTTTPSEYLAIGNRTGATEGFKGILDDLRIYNRVLSAAEIATIFACRGSDGIAYGLLHRYMLNELPEDVTSSATEVVKDSGLSKYNATPAGGAITLDDSGQGIGGTGSESLTFSYTIGSGNNRLLIVGLEIENQNDTMTIDTVTYNSVDVTEINQAEGESGGGDAYRQYSWLGYLLDEDLPSAGSYNVTIETSNGPNRAIMCAVASYFNVKQAAPEDSDIFESTVSVSNSYVNVTASQNGSLVVGVAGHGGIESVSGYDSSILVETLVGVSQTGALVHKLGVNSGSYDLGVQWSGGTSRASAIGAVFQKASPDLTWKGTRLKYRRMVH